MSENSPEFELGVEYSLGVSSPHYIPANPCGRGHRLRYKQSRACVECLASRGRDPVLRKKNLEARRRAISTPEGAKKNRESVKRSMQRPESRAKQREAYKRYARSPKGKATIKGLIKARRALRRGAVPPWADLKAVSLFIRQCPEGYHVDHIIPLKGVSVSGLHTLENLQYLPAEENRNKNNAIDPGTLDGLVCVLPAFRRYERM